VVESHDSLADVEASGLRVSLDRRVHVASLRYFDRDGSFAAKVRANVGGPLPSPLGASSTLQSRTGNPIVLAWRSPTETIVLCSAQMSVKSLEADLATSRDGCVVDQTGGAWVLRMSGDRVGDAFARLGGQGVLPTIGEARCGRLADVPVLAIQVGPGEVLLVVERVYAGHLLNWLRTSAADFESNHQGRPAKSSNGVV
jgi:sarcosine oxidase gamma subunit